MAAMKTAVAQYAWCGKCQANRTITNGTAGSSVVPVAATNNLNFGNPERPEIMAQLVESIEGMAEACKFFETPITNRIELWDHMAHVWSTYQSRHSQGEQPFARGINSIALMNDGTRWWIITVYWESEDKDHPLPEKYLSN